LPAASALAKRHVSYGAKARHYPVVGAALLWTLDDFRSIWSQSGCRVKDIPWALPTYPRMPEGLSPATNHIFGFGQRKTPECKNQNWVGWVAARWSKFISLIDDGPHFHRPASRYAYHRSRDGATDRSKARKSQLKRRRFRFLSRP
jgi:hypothetical protein